MAFAPADFMVASLGAATGPSPLRDTGFITDEDRVLYRDDLEDVPPMRPFGEPVDFEAYRPSARIMLGEFVALSRATAMAPARPVRYRKSHRRPEQSSATPVLLIPGYLSPDRAMAPTHRYLRSKGFRTFAAQRGYASGCWSDQSTASKGARNVCGGIRSEGGIGGHSLGGIQAVVLGVRRPDLVSGVITLGAPLRGGADVSWPLTIVATASTGLSRLGLPWFPSADCVSGECWNRTAALLESSAALGMPFVTVFSRFDGMVPRRSATHPCAEHVEVAVSHCGLGTSREVWRIVESRLADMRDPRGRRLA